MGNTLANHLQRLERQYLAASRKCSKIDRLEAQLASLRGEASELIARRDHLGTAIEHLRSASAILGSSDSPTNGGGSTGRPKKVLSPERLEAMQRGRRAKAAARANGGTAAATSTEGDPVLGGSTENSHGECELIFSDDVKRNKAVRALEGRGFVRAPRAQRPLAGQFSTSQLGSSTFMVSWAEPEDE